MQSSSLTSGPDAVVIGGGPAGLMAAEVLLTAGYSVILAETRPSVGRKFLMAGKSGLNLTKSQPFDAFMANYTTSESKLRPILEGFSAKDVSSWAEGLGQTLFTGSTGRIFPTAMKASPLLRAWLARLDQLGLERRVNWRWTGWNAGQLVFQTPEGPQNLSPSVTILALGGSSWARLGSDGKWTEHLNKDSVPLTPFAPSNAGLTVNWSSHMAQHFGTPLKNISLTAGPMRSRGELVISSRGLEGGGLYPLSPALRDGHPLALDLAPDLDEAALVRRLSKPRGKQSLASHLRKTLRMTPQQQAILMEFARPLPAEVSDLATLLKAVPIRHDGFRPIDEAISTAGGVAFDALDDGLMLTSKPGVFCAGEMLDWDAPTGGYLITACLATGRWAGRNAAARLERG